LIWQMVVKQCDNSKRKVEHTLFTSSATLIPDLDPAYAYALHNPGRLQSSLILINQSLRIYLPTSKRTSAVPARLGPKALALAWPEGAPAL